MWQTSPSCILCEWRGGRSEVPGDEEGTHPPCCSEMGYVVSI